MDHIGKLFSRIPKKHRLQLAETINCLLDPACRVSLSPEKLSGSSGFRVRSGQYWIIFRKDADGDIVIDDVRLRNEKTYRDI